MLDLTLEAWERLKKDQLDYNVMRSKIIQRMEEIHMNKNNTTIPEHLPTFEEISSQMIINARLAMKMVTDHVNNEIARFKREIKIGDL